MTQKQRKSPPTHVPEKNILEHDFHFVGYLKGFGSKQDLEDFIHLLLFIHPNFYISGEPLPSIFQVHFQGGNIEVYPFDSQKNTKVSYEISTNLIPVEMQIKILEDLDEKGCTSLSVGNSRKGRRKFFLKARTISGIKNQVTAKLP